MGPPPSGPARAQRSVADLPAAAPGAAPDRHYARRLRQAAVTGDLPSRFMTGWVHAIPRLRVTSFMKRGLFAGPVADSSRGPDASGLRHSSAPAIRDLGLVQEIRGCSRSDDPPHRRGTGLHSQGCRSATARDGASTSLAAVGGQGVDVIPYGVVPLLPAGVQA